MFGMMKRIVKYFNGFHEVNQRLRDLQSNVQLSTSQIEQKKCFLHYQQLVNEKRQLPSISDVGFRVFSQSDEDGILLYVFALIGTTNKRCLDIAYASPIGANTTNLLCNWGWHGLLVCGDEQEAVAARKFFNAHPDTVIYPPLVTTQWVTAENVNDILKTNDFTGEIDLLSLDIDGVDYWIWKNLTDVSPRVIIVEANNVLGMEKSVTVPYDPKFNRFSGHKDYMGASVRAFIKLGEEKGYRLVGCNKYGFNLFFLKKGIAEDLIPTMPLERCFEHPQAAARKKESFAEISKLPWIEV